MAMVRCRRTPERRQPRAAPLDGPGGSPIDSPTAARYLSAFTELWDEHRQPMGFGNAGMALNAAAMLVGALWLTRFKSALPPTSMFVLRFITVSGLVSVACVAISHVSPDRLPGFLIVLMPTRVVNVDAVMFAATIIGVAARYRSSVWGRVLLVGLIAGLLLNHQGLLSPKFERLVSDTLEPRLLTLVVLLAGAALLTAGTVWTTWISRGHMRSPLWFRLGADLAVVGMMAAALIPGVVHLPPRSEAATFRDRTNDGLFATAARAGGMLLTGGDLHLAQLRTRRPVVIDGGGLDGLAYAVAGAPETERILRDVYGIDFFIRRPRHTASA